MSGLALVAWGFAALYLCVKAAIDSCDGGKR